MRAIFGLLLLSSLLLPSSSPGATFFTDRASWESASPEALLRQVDLAEGSGPLLLIDGDVVTYPDGFSIEGDGAGGLAVIRPFGFPLFPAPHIETDFEIPATRLIFRFEEAILGFAFEYTEAEYAESILISGVSEEPLTTPINASTTPAFFGFEVETPLSEFSIATAARDQQYRILNLGFRIVPEPSTGLFVTIGLVPLSLYARVPARRARRRSGRRG